MARPKLKIDGHVHEMEITTGPTRDLAYAYVVKNGWRMACHTIPTVGKFEIDGHKYEWLEDPES